MCKEKIYILINDSQKFKSHPHRRSKLQLDLTALPLLLPPLVPKLYAVHL